MFAITRIRTVSVAAAVGLATSAALVVVPPAQAAVGDLVCIPPSSTTISYSPALTSSPQTATASVTFALSSCVSTTVPAITSGTAQKSAVVLNRSCLNLTGSSSSASTITWNTGQTSSILVTSIVTIVGAVYNVTSTGTVTSGLFAGDTVVADRVGAATDILLCTLGLGTVSSGPTTTTLTFA